MSNIEVGLIRYQSLVNEIDTLRLEKVKKVQEYNLIIDKHQNYRDRRVEANIATYTKKINQLEKIRVRYQGGDA